MKGPTVSVDTDTETTTDARERWNTTFLFLVGLILLAAAVGGAWVTAANDIDYGDITGSTQPLVCMPDTYDFPGSTTPADPAACDDWNAGAQQAHDDAVRDRNLSGTALVVMLAGVAALTVRLVRLPRN